MINEILEQDTVSAQTLSAATRKAMQARELELEIASLEERLKNKKSQLYNIYTVELPNLMDQAQTDRLGIPPQGNLPGYDLKLTVFYEANIAANWPQEKRDAAFSALAKAGAQSLIKTDVSLAFPREEYNIAQGVVRILNEMGYHPNIKQSIHHKTLSAWLKEQYERGNEVPPLDIIGANVGRIVKMTERND